MSDRYRYVTPYGKWNAKLQDHGKWAGSFRVTVGPPAYGVRVLDRVAREWGEQVHPDLPAIHSLTPGDRRVNWVFPPGANWSPVAAGPTPLPPDEARRVVFAVGDLLAAMHAAGSAAGDLSPELVFRDGENGRVTLLPTLGLADLTGLDPEAVADLPFVAPEYGGRDPVDPVRADVYALGAFAHWLTGGTEDWAAFVAGCVANAPGDRYDSVPAALAVLGRADPVDPADTPTIEAVPPVEPMNPPGIAPRPLAVDLPVPAARHPALPPAEPDAADPLGVPDALAAVALLSAVAGVAVAYFSGDRNWLIALFGGGFVFTVLSLLGVGGKKLATDEHG